jgi:hypothetical protein
LVNRKHLKLQKTNTIRFFIFEGLELDTTMDHPYESMSDQYWSPGFWQGFISGMILGAILASLVFMDKCIK